MRLLSQMSRVKSQILTRFNATVVYGTMSGLNLSLFFMSRRRHKKQRHNSNGKRRGDVLPRIEVNPETKRWISIVFFLAFAGVSMLALFGLAGKVGVAIDRILTLFFGNTKLLFPILLLIVGYIFITKKKINALPSIGIIVFVFSITALVHIFIPFNEALEAVDEGRGGGYL